MSDYNALIFNPDASHNPRAKHFIPRQGARNKQLSIAFDPAAHKEWVTGFRKRKNERKTAGMKLLEAQAKTERQEERDERRKKKKERLQLPDDYGIEDSENEEDLELKQKVTDQAVYSNKGVTTTVTTAALEFGVGSDEEHSDSDTCAEANLSRARKGQVANAFPSALEDEGRVQKDPADVGLPKSHNPKKNLHKVKDGKSGPHKAANKLAQLKAKRAGVKKPYGAPKSKGKDGKKGKRK